MVREVEPSSVDAIFLRKLRRTGIERCGFHRAIRVTYFSKTEGNSPCQAEILPMICALARAKRTWVFAGTMPLAVRPDKTPSKMAVLEPLHWSSTQQAISWHGTTKYTLRREVSDTTKVYRESSTFEPGDQPAVVTAPFTLPV